MPVWVELRGRAGFIRFKEGDRAMGAMNATGHIIVLDDRDRAVAVFPAEHVIRAQREDPKVTDRAEE